MTRRTIELDPVVADAALWLQERADATDFGTVTVRLVKHAGRLAYVERETAEKTKLQTARGGGAYGRDDR